MDFSQIKPVELDEDRRSVDMSRFWGDGVTVYAREITPRDHSKVAKTCKGWPQSAGFDGLIHMLTLVAQTEDGSPFFPNPIKDRQVLGAMPMRILNPLFSLLGDVSGAEDESDELLVKNSEMTR